MISNQPMLALRRRDCMRDFVEKIDDPTNTRADYNPGSEKICGPDSK